jgi:hypothetical protein
MCQKHLDRTNACNRARKLGQSLTSLINRPIATRRVEFVEFLATTNLSTNDELDAGWWAADIRTGRSKIRVTCSVCLLEFDAAVADLFNGRSNCRCHGHGSWKSESARGQLLRIIDGAGFEPTGFLLSAVAYEARKVTSYTKLPIQCRKCGAYPEKSTVFSFTQSRSAGCHCNHKIQTRVAEFVHSIVPVDCLVKEEYYTGVRSSKGRRMPYDFAVVTTTGKLLLLIEIDGQQHFAPGWLQSKAEFRHRLEKDLAKEQHALSIGIPVVRLLAHTANRPTHDWKSWLRDIVLAACQGSLPIVVIRDPFTKQYDMNAYAAIRNA